MRSKPLAITLCLLIITLITACNPSVQGSSAGTFPVDKSFSDFYAGFGAGDVLGPAISPSFVKDGITYQYVVTGLMAYNPALNTLNRFYFSPIASAEWGINDPIDPAADADGSFINGHRIWEEAAPLYNQYGVQVVGMPLTGVSANDAKQRYEQYFEGLGFYRNYIDPPGEIHLMPYGAWMCGSDCQYQVSDTGHLAVSYQRQNSEIEQLFLQASERLGYGFTGRPIAPPELGEDGNYQMLFENTLLFLDAKSGNQMKLRPLSTLLGVRKDDPTRPLQESWLEFYPTADGAGFNIPRIFVEYLGTHGGMANTGAPITQFSKLADGGYSQCFENICLEYHPTAPLELRIRPHALGRDYKTGGANLVTPEAAFSDALQITVREEFPLIKPGTIQVIHVDAKKNNAPAEGLEFSLVVNQPDGISKSYKMDPTGRDGKASIQLAPIDGPNGAIIQYEICLTGGIDTPICFSRSYTIWNQ